MSLSCRAASVGCPFVSSSPQGLGIHWKSCKYRDHAISNAFKKRKAHDDMASLAQKRLRLEEAHNVGQVHPVVSIQSNFLPCHALTWFLLLVWPLFADLSKPTSCT